MDEPLETNLKEIWRLPNLFLAYLADCAGTAPAPRKARIDPIELSRIGVLSSTWIVERANQTDFRYRIAGEMIIDAFAQPIVGKLASELFDPDTWDAIRRRWLRCINRKEAYANRATVIDPKGYQHDGTRVAVPLLDEAGIARFIIGVTIYGTISKITEQPTSVKVAALEPTFFDLHDWSKSRENGIVVDDAFASKK